MILAVSENLASQKESRLFELGRVFEKAAKKTSAKADTPSIESRMLCLGQSIADLSGAREEESNFFALLSSLQSLLSLSGASELRLEPRADAPAWMHPYRAAKLLVSGKEVGALAEVKPSLVGGKRVAVSEINLSTLAELSAESEASIKPISKYPASYFEMSVVMPERDCFSDLEKLIRANVESSKLLDLEVLSVYAGKPLADGLKSVSVKLSLGSDEGTLSGDELESIQSGLMGAVDKSAYELRT